MLSDKFKNLFHSISLWINLDLLSISESLRYFMKSLACLTSHACLCLIYIIWTSKNFAPWHLAHIRKWNGFKIRWNCLQLNEFMLDFRESKNHYTGVIWLGQDISPLWKLHFLTSICKILLFHKFKTWISWPMLIGMSFNYNLDLFCDSLISKWGCGEWLDTTIAVELKS